jgi:hypothetical protein
VSYGPSPTLVEELTRDIDKPTLEQIEEAKREIHERYSREELEQLKSLADKLRTPMNRKARRALQSRIRRAA